MKLILFNIDGTLIETGGAGTKAMDLAFEEVLSIPAAFQDIEMAGETDVVIMKKGLIKHGLPVEDRVIGLLRESYLRHLGALMLIDNPRKRLKPFIKKTLERFSTIDEYRLGLLTGNLEAGARIKLGSFGLNGFFPFGAFGDDDEDRNKLLPIAVERFNRMSGATIGYKDCVVIGDTPMDVECAKVHGARSIAVATGPYTYQALASSGADLVLRTIADLQLSS